MGNIVEDELWRACPQGYVYNSSVNQISNTGFEETLNPSHIMSNIVRGSTPNGSTSNLVNSGNQTDIHNNPGAGALHHDQIDFRSQHSGDQFNDESEIRSDGSPQNVRISPNLNNDAVYDGSLGLVPRIRQDAGQYFGDLPQTFTQTLRQIHVQLAHDENQQKFYSSNRLVQQSPAGIFDSRHQQAQYRV